MIPEGTSSVNTDCMCTSSIEPTLKINDASVSQILPAETSTHQTSQLNQIKQTDQTVGVGRKEYQSSDTGPYIVHVQRITNTENSGTILHPIAFGNFLKTNKFQNIVPGSVKRIGRNKCVVAFTNPLAANSFLNSNLLSLNKFKAFLPTFNVTRMGLVRGVPSEWSEEEIKENITTPIGTGAVLKIRRLNYKVMVNGSPTWKPSQTVVVTFDGQALPRRIYICYNALSVETYVYPTIQCFRCCRYGHTKIQCRSAAPRCFKCAQNHLGESCVVEEDSASCVNCSGLHYATNKTCPEFQRQKNIKHTMAHSCVSYAEASKAHPAASKSYANTLSTGTPDFHNKNNYFSSQPKTSTSSSHKKTVFLKPRAPPKSAQGYDRAAHNALVRDLQPPSLANGCALPKESDMKLQQNENEQVVDVIINLIKMLLCKNISFEPYDVERLSSLLLNKNLKDGHNNSMELPISNT